LLRIALRVGPPPAAGTPSEGRLLGQADQACDLGHRQVGRREVLTCGVAPHIVVGFLFVSLLPAVETTFNSLAARTTSRASLPPHLSAAAQLFLHGPLTVGELAEQLAVTYATASLVATDLERARAIERERDPADGRRVVLRLHPTKAMNHRIEPMRRTLQRLDAAARKTFVKAMSIFIEELEGR
jgi:DNA-binding MarR family transcriptional regulator